MIRCTFRRRTLLSASAVSLALALSLGAQASAQEAEEAEEARSDDVVVVTGIRASLASSIAEKRANSSIVEAISAEDIGRLPDVSIAESLARLPGLAAQRLDGRAQVISVRGLGPDFTTALLNGREQVSVGDNRGVEFDQYPSELLRQVVVYKTPDAQLIGQGLAGTVDLRTVRPLAHGERTIAANARYEWNDLGALNAGTDDTGYRLSASIIDQNEEGTLGWALGIAHMNSPTQVERFNAWGYPQTGAGELIIGGAKPFVQSNLIERTGIIGVLEYQPTDTFSMTLDAFYSSYQEDQTLRGIEFPLFWSGAQLQPGYTVEDGLVTQGQFNNVVGVVRNDYQGRDSELWSVGANFDFEIGAGWRGEVDLSHSSVSREDTNLESYSGTGFNQSGPRDNLGFRIAPGGGGAVFTSILNYADPALIRLTSPQGWGGDIFTDSNGDPAGQAGYLNVPSIDDELSAVRFSADRDVSFGPFTTIEFGVSYSQRTKSKRADEWFIGLANGQAEAAIPANLILGSTELGFLGIPGMVSYDPRALLSQGVYRLRPNTNPDVPTKAWTVDETVWIGYAQANIDGALGSIPMTGNVGLQIVHTDQGSDGFATQGNTAAPISGGASYTEWLPSANLSFEVADNTFVRVAAARTLMRARMDQLRASIQVSENPAFVNQDPLVTGQSYWGGGGGNPELRPYIANQFDVSIERYFGSSGYVSAAAFYKDLETFIDNATFLRDFSGLTPTQTLATPASSLGVTGAPVNLSGGYISGLEFSLSLPGDLIHPALDGFGLIANTSILDSEIEPQPGNIVTVPGLSDNVTNITAYYENAGFEARISRRHRGDFLGEVQGFGAGRTLRTVREESVYDAQIGYQFQAGQFDGLTVLFQVNNLTDEEFATFNNGDQRQIIDYQRYGRTFLVGLNYRR